MAKFKVGDRVKVRKKFRMLEEHVYGTIVGDRGYGIFSVNIEGSRPPLVSSEGWIYYDMELKPDDRKAEQSPDPVREHPTLDEVVAGVQGQDVQLTLTRSEAETLALILSYIGGKGTGRHRVLNIGRKLDEARVMWSLDVNVQHYSEPMDPISCPGLRLVDVS